jgi:hypothetical protein
MRNELRDREPAVSHAQPPVQDDAVSVGEAQAGINAMKKGLPWMAGGYPGAIGVSDAGNGGSAQLPPNLLALTALST